MNDDMNVVFVLADDLAVWALGCYGNPEIRTPNIDALAADGIRFTEFYCTSPVCSPARASLFTGKMPSSHGVQDWIRGGNDGAEPIEYLAGHRAYTEILAEHGYSCGISGKWHLGNSPHPQKGHSSWFVHPGGGGPYNDAQMYENGSLVNTEGYLSDVITDQAIDFLRTQVADHRQFHLSVTFTAPHSPWVDQHPKDLVDSYADCAFLSCPQETRHPWIAHHPIEMDNPERLASPGRGTVTVRDHLQGYFAAVTAMDSCVGRLRQEIRELGIEHNTLIVFMSDNGFNCGQHGIWGKGNATFPQNMYDSSVKVPAIMALPGVIPPGTSDAMLSGYDFMPTILDFLDLSDELPSGLPGHSFLGLLDGTAQDPDRAVVVYDEFGPTRMIRTREWKYVHRYPYGPHELYDMLHDPDECVNLLTDQRVWDATEPDRARQAMTLRARLETWFHQFSDPDADGRVQPIAGRGQIGLVGKPGSPTFHGPESHKVLDEATKA